VTAVPVPPALPAAAYVFVPDLGLSLPLLIDVPDAGAMGHMSRWASYRAAQDGTIPTLKVGNRLRVPTCAWLERLGLRYEAVLQDHASRAVPGSDPQDGRR
jgi:hypothetical protein